MHETNFPIVLTVQEIVPHGERESPGSGTVSNLLEIIRGEPNTMSGRWNEVFAQPLVGYSTRSSQGELY